MKKRNWRRALSLGLVLAMTLSMAACSGGGGKKDKDENVNAELAKQNVYRYQEVDLGEFDSENGYRSVLSSAIAGDKAYLLFREEGYDPERSMSYSDLVLYEVNKDGSDVKTVTLEKVDSASDDGAGDDQSAASQPGDADDAESTEDTTSEDGGAEPELPEEDKESVTSSSSVDIAVEPGYVDEEYSFESEYYGQGTISADRIYAYREHRKERNDENGYFSENKSYIDCWDLQGKLIFSTNIDISKYQNDDTWSYVNGIISLADGSAAIMMGGDQQGLINISKDGVLSEVKPQSSEKDIFERQAGTALRSDGTMIVSYYDEEYTKQYITTYDPVTGEYGTEYEIPALAKNYGLYRFTTGFGRDVVFSARDGLYGFNLGDTEAVKIMDYVNSDLPVYSLKDILMVDETKFFASFNDPVDYTMKFCLFSYVKPEDIQEKKVLVFAGIYLGSEIKQQIIRFNKENQDYRIVVKDYSTYNTDEDYTAGRTRLNNDIIAGAVPDILCLSDDLPVENMISQGLFADIDKMIKEDPELSQIEFMDNVFEAYRVDGVLYRVIPAFSIQTFIGKKSLFGDRTGITMEELNQIAQGVGGEARLFENVSRENFISMMMRFCGSDFVDVNTGKCDFDTELFVSFLEYAKTLLTDEELWGDGYDEDFWNEYYENYDSQWREDRTLLMNGSLNELSNMKRTINGTFGEDVAYVGFPTESGQGSCIQANESYAISKKSANIEGAWEFLRTFLTEDYQKNEDQKYGYRWGLSVHKNLVRENADLATQKSFYLDENGEKVEYDDTFYLNGQEITIDPLSQAQADELFNFVCSVTKPMYYNQDVQKIIDEEVQAFFSGQKSAKDAAAMIQNRVQLYVNENK